MGLHRNGARTFLTILKKACDLSRLPGFQSGLSRILGGTTGENIYALWLPLCAAIDVIVATDNWYNQKDASEDYAEDEDVTLGI